MALLLITPFSPLYIIHHLKRHIKQSQKYFSFFEVSKLYNCYKAISEAEKTSLSKTHLGFQSEAYSSYMRLKIRNRKQK